MYCKRILTSIFPVLYSPNETVPIFSWLFLLPDPDPGGISGSETLFFFVVNFVYYFNRTY